jgi:hypothetical protein
VPEQNRRLTAAAWRAPGVHGGPGGRRPRRTTIPASRINERRV